MEQYKISYLHVTERLDNSNMVYSLHGELDLCSSPELSDRLITAIHDDTVETLSVDLSDLTFMDCGGLRVFITAHNAAKEQDKTFQLRRPSLVAQRLLQLAKVDKIMTIEDAELA